MKTLLLLWAIRLGLWLLRFDHLRKLLFRAQPVKTIGGGPGVKQIASDVTRMSRYVPAATCLTQALVTLVILRRHGYLGSLCIGVNKSRKGKLEAHAWVESSGQIVIGGRTDLSRFTLLRPVLEV